MFASRSLFASGRSLGIALAISALVLFGLSASIASAATYLVDSKADEADQAVGTDGCKTAAAVCSLRAAIEESNNSVGADDQISFAFSATAFNGLPADSTITLGSGLPPITNKVEINGSSCVTPVGAPVSPCAEITGPSSASLLTIDDTDDVTINGISLTGGQRGINVIDSSEALKLTNSWVGVKLDGSAGGNLAAGISIDPDSNGAAIGGTELGERNVISNNGIGLDVLGADQTVVRGNFFGVRPDGSTPAPNNKNIEITDSTAGAGFEAASNEIGAQMPLGAPTAGCDSGCNVISGAAYGIDLNGNGALQEEAPASGPTLIHSNHVGLNGGGMGAVPNTSYGIMVGAADQVTIGGPSVSGVIANVNRISGGEYGIFAAEGEGLKVELNAIGTNAVGQTIAAPSAVGIFNLALGVADPAQITSNGITMAGGVGIEQRFTGSEIAENNVRGAEVGIRTVVSGGEGSLIEANGIEGATANGILIEDDGNEVLGNFVIGSGGAGIRIQTPSDDGLLPSTGNRIGGSADEENTIDDSGGDAIEISNLEDSDNEVGANLGTGNAGQFIDLIAANPGTEPNGPNQGIKPPTISSASTTSVGGSALPGAKVLVFAKASAAPGELQALLGETSADGAGAWNLAYENESGEAEALPLGADIAALQTSTSGGSSELALAVTATPPPGEKPIVGGGDSGGSAGPAPGDKAPPQTRIAKKPKPNRRSKGRKFRFSSSEPGSTFECKLDRQRFRRCRSPKAYGKLRPGGHTFRVRAIDAAGNVDPTPAKKRFSISG